MNLVDFLTKQKPICDKFPLYDAVSGNYELEAALKDRSIADFGENLISKRCANRFMCSTECVGRPIPKYSELEPSLSSLNKVTEGTYRGKQVWLSYVITCNDCKIQDSCEALCGSMVSYLDKHTAEEGIFEDRISDISNMPEEVIHEAMETDHGSSPALFDLALLRQVPWDCLTNNQKHVLNAKFYTLKSERQIATELKITHTAVQKNLTSGLAKLKEFYLGRKALEVDSSNKVAELYYSKCLNIYEITKILNISKASASRLLVDFKNTHSLST